MIPISASVGGGADTVTPLGYSFCPPATASAPPTVAPVTVGSPTPGSVNVGIRPLIQYDYSFDAANGRLTFTVRS
ncbi:hypothetical protein M2352_003547 [Azospirillum fermentarium]|uniref:hypothetical protein n=1 Tax=Azospirillum fermentarium TaxID=1233114 RepID=UPI0022275CF0|nr:hypothetical protein [Azospirillum fermentarium]MCW2247913.1 hypothetical protein [Azospirillum fermentarium]